jgi:hypothetical protein
MKNVENLMLYTGMPVCNIHLFAIPDYLKYTVSVAHEKLLSVLVLWLFLQAELNVALISSGIGPHAAAQTASKYTVSAFPIVSQ